MNQLQDTDQMPFGKHRGACMLDDPAKYFLWLWTDGGDYGPMERRLDHPVADYIRRNLDALEMDYPDGIWRTS